MHGAILHFLAAVILFEHFAEAFVWAPPLWVDVRVVNILAVGLRLSLLFGMFAAMFVLGTLYLYNAGAAPSPSCACTADWLPLDVRWWLLLVSVQRLNDECDWPAYSRAAFAAGKLVAWFLGWSHARVPGDSHAMENHVMGGLRSE